MSLTRKQILVYGATAKVKKGVTAAATVSLPWERRGDLAALLRRFDGVTGAPGRIAWKRVRGENLEWWKALVDALYAREWLSLRVVVGLNEDARVEALVGRTATGQPPPPVRHLLRLAGKPKGGAVPRAGVRHLRVRETPALQIARFLATALQAAYGARKVGKAQARLLAHVGAKVGVSDLTALGGTASARLAVWRPHELAAA